jgi:hypothetical protein
MVIPSVHAQLHDASHWLKYVGEWGYLKISLTAKVPRFKPCWIFSCGIIKKENYYMIKPCTINGLKGSIYLEKEIAAIPADILQHVFASLEHHIQSSMDWGVWGGGTTSSTLHEGMQLHKD